MKRPTMPDKLAKSASRLEPQRFWQYRNPCRLAAGASLVFGALLSFLAFLAFFAVTYFYFNFLVFPPKADTPRAQIFNEQKTRQNRVLYYSP